MTVLGFAYLAITVYWTQHATHKARYIFLPSLLSYTTHDYSKSNYQQTTRSLTYTHHTLTHSSVERFAEEMDTLLEITLRSNLVEKLSMALYDCLFEEEDGNGAADGGNESKVSKVGCSWYLYLVHVFC